MFWFGFFDDVFCFNGDCVNVLLLLLLMLLDAFVVCVKCCCERKSVGKGRL